jgi:hypothetical protein
MRLRAVTSLYRTVFLTPVYGAVSYYLGIKVFVLLGVYTKNRAFRLLRSSKFDKPECFNVAPENKWKPNIGRSSIRPGEIERQIFMASLVYFNGYVIVDFL